MTVRVIRPVAEMSPATRSAPRPAVSDPKAISRIPSVGRNPMRRRRQWMWRPYPTSPRSPAAIRREAA